MLHRSPRVFGLQRSRWWLAGLGQVVKWLQRLTLPGIYQILRRLGLSYKRGQAYLHSPDLHYDEKWAVVRAIEELVAQRPQECVMVFEDELTYYRRPSIAQGYAPRGSHLPLARQGYRPNASMRIAGCLNRFSGQLFCWQRPHFDRRTLIRYYQALRDQYPHAMAIFVIQDNWPVHFHDEILAALASTPIVLVPLPTYAPWTNPIEKVWRKLYQEVLHLHDFVDRWVDLRQNVAGWLRQFEENSPDLLHYVGLYPD